MPKNNKQKPKKDSALLEGLASKDIKVEHGQIELVDETEREKKKHWARRHITLTALPLLLVIIVCWVLAGIYIPKVRLGNNLVSARQSDTKLQSIVQKNADNYKLTVIYPNGSKKNFSLSDMGLYVDPSATVASLRQKQHQFASRLQWWHPNIGYSKLTMDSDLLEKFISQQATVTEQPAKDAAISIKDGKVQVSGSVAGKHSGLVEPVATLTASAARLIPETLKLQTLATRPAITSQQLAASEAILQKILSQSVIFIIDDKKIKASPADIAQWLELTPKNSGRAVDVTINSGKVLAYISKISASSVHPSKAQIQLISTEGISSVLIKGVNGTDVLNESQSADEVTQSLLQNKAIQEVLDIKFSAYKTITAQAYPKWIEVDTANKRMYAYEQSNLVRTFLISAGAPRTPTVTGQYAIYSKYAQQDMRGHNVDGSSYFQPKVPWVNYFYADYAIHGNYWRPLSYFGYINSSHGCVGVVESDAQWIYSWAPIGTPVIVHT